MIAQVYCPHCGWVDVQDTELLNVEEGMQGEDRATFICNECGNENVSVVTMRHEDDCEEYYVDDSMDGDFDSAMASAGFGTDEDYCCTEEY